MSRRERPFAPGCVFHLTGRTNNKEPWLEADTIKNEAMQILADCVGRNDVVLLAFAIMSNHVHLLIRQGPRPLSCFAQSLFRRLALRIQLRHDREGHIFKGSYYSGLVGSVDHMRVAIDYIHSNPVEAGLCKSTDEYAWSSCPFYTGCDTSHLPPNQPQLTTALDIFASHAGRTTKQLQSDYRKFAAHRAVCRALPKGAPMPRGPVMRAGEDLWRATYGTLLEAHQPKRADLRDIVLRVMRDLAPELTLDLLQSHRGGPTIAAVRQEIVRQATLVGYRGVAIADFLHISKATVSMIRARLDPIPALRPPLPVADSAVGQD